MNLEWLRVGVIGALCAVVSTGYAMDALEEQVLPSMASDAQSTDWELLGNSPDMQHHSGLNQINTETVSDLGLAWAIDLPTRDGLVGNPLISNGRIFQGGSQSQVFANDLKTGKLLWTYEPLADRPPGSFLETWLRSINRGVALYEDLVIVGTSDCRLVAIDQATGVKRWEAETCDGKQNYMISGAPRVGGGKVFIGNSCADMGLNRGHVDAVDARTGKHLWRFYTVPGDPSKPQDSELYEMAAKTWGDGWYESTKGCGSVWDAMVYDPELDQLIIGTGAPAPSDPTKRGKNAGDELFTNAVVALDAETGAYRWHFSQVPGDGWNYEPAVGLMTATLPIDERGQARRPQRAEERLRLSPGREDRRVHLGAQLRAGQLGERPRRRDRATDLRPCCTLLGSGRRRDHDRPSEQCRCARLDRAGIRPPEERALHPRDDDARTV